MKRRRNRNKRLSSQREIRKKYFVEGVVKRGTNAAWISFCRWTGLLVKTLAVVALGAGLYFGVTRGWKTFFSENPDYALKEIHFMTDGSLTREQALQTINLKPGQNFFSYDIAAAREALRRLPQVDAADVRSYLPDRIEISVHERSPAAWVVPKLSDKTAKRGQAYLLDSRGLVFQPRHVPHEFQTLPTISGVQIEDLEPGKRLRKAEVDAALELLRRARDTGSFKVITVDVSKGYCMVATDQKNAQLTFGLDDLAGQFDRLATVQAETALIGQEIQTVNLIPARNIPVTFMPPTPPETDDDDPEPVPPPAGTKNTAVATTKSAGSVTTKGASSATTKAAPSSSAKARTTSPAKKSEPSKPKDAPNKENIGLLKRFRTA